MKATNDQDDTESIRVRTAIEPAPSLPVCTEIERRAIAWISPYNQALHLERARDWLAVVTHDIERMFPNGPQLDKATGRFDDPHYLYAHAARSAEVVGFWLHAQADVPEEFSLSEVQRLITLHEFGGVGGADLVQAADSLSFLETLQDVVRKWVTHGECDAEQARAKHRYMADRIRIPAAQQVAGPLLEQALASLDDL
jgi:hypothetical protein